MATFGIHAIDAAIAQNDDGTTITERVLFTPALAREWLDTINFPHQRPINTDKVRELVRAIQSGAYRQTAPITTRIIHELDDQEYIVDGQHQLEAIAQSGASLSLLVVRERIATFEMAAADYAVFDTNRTRSARDSARAFDLPAELGISQSLLDKMVLAAPLILSGFNGSAQGQISKDRLARVAFVREWAEYAKLAEVALESVGYRHRLYNQGYFSVILVTCKYAPEKAQRFWRAIAENDGLRKGTAEHKLLEWINTNSVRSSDAPRFARYAAYAWNRAYPRLGGPDDEGSEASTDEIIRWGQINPNDPIIIRGTPAAGVQHIVSL